MFTVEQLVAFYKLEPHPEGGFYKETYRSKETIEQAGLPQRFSGDRSFSTAIYFLLPAGHFSAFHRIQSDELWHFYAGEPLHIYVINEQGKSSIITLGADILKGETMQAVVVAGCWFASRPVNNTGYSFVGCTVSPGFDFADFELAKTSELMQLYPQHGELIQSLCRQ
ncbi:MAG: cupin domain-containing protein [Chitinophagaceae bacterium]|nr:cupin domain-containing protein [Chitinophagaceae bacterium]